MLEIVSPKSRETSNKEIPIEIKSSDWTGVFTKLQNSIRVRHYSQTTLKTYSGWVRKFQAFTKSKDPRLLGTEDVKEFLTSLAVEKRVAASTQNQAFNALLFFYRHVLGKEFGKVEGVVRAKRKPYIPVVLSREEIDQILAKLNMPYHLIISLMYGCGLRISECLSLRVNNFNFDMKVLTIHDGKGKKDRTVPIPDILLSQLKTQLESVIALHERDCQGGYSGVFLPNQLEVKYKNAARELVWQWFFPAKQLTVVENNNELRRYHVH
ncbi:phage integrase N-terminal SAM-like domain-containing protein, partial [Desulfopila inferna]|uniref:phage integrase N-terminal SAM-like domain-containing protein n=1 Tax=Desulfopila inferna TaxID=468528 RepID=UPI001F06658B